MNRIKKALALIFAFSLLLGLCTVFAGAADEEKTVVLTGYNTTAKVVAATEDTPAHTEFDAIVDGELTKVRHLNPPWAVSAGPHIGTFNADGYLVSTAERTGYESGYSVHGFSSDGSRLILGVKKQAYAFVPDLKVTIASGFAVYDSPVMDIAGLAALLEDVRVGYLWNAEYRVWLNEAGEITEMYIIRGQEALEEDDTQFKLIEQFNVAKGPAVETAGVGDYASEYLYYTPEVTAGEKYPLVIWFHGAFSGINTWTSMFNSNDIMLFASEEYQAKFHNGGAYVITPRSAEFGGIGWLAGMTTPVLAAIDDFIVKNPQVDTSRIYVGGFSMGGGMTWWMLQARPDMFAAAFPVCPVGSAVPESANLSPYAHIPIWQFHGHYDTTVPVTVTTDIADTLTANGDEADVDTRVTIFDHIQNPDKTYLDPTLGDIAVLEHLSWQPVLQNLTFHDGTLHTDINGDAVPGTLLEWMTAQRASRPVTIEDMADVAPNKWYYDAVNYVIDSGIMQGSNETTFAPESALTRGMLVQMLYNLEGRPAAGDPGFIDVPGDAWYADASAWAAAGGIVSGVGDNRLAPMRNITREQMAVMLHNYCVFKDIDLPVIRETGSFTDEEAISPWAAEAADTLYKAGILNGRASGAFDPQGSATRGEVAQMFMNFMAAIE